MFRRWARDKTGGTAIEYAMIASLIAAVVIVGITTMTTNMGSVYTKIETAVASAMK